jgi:hypothetical protein
MPPAMAVSVIKTGSRQEGSFVRSEAINADMMSSLQSVLTFDVPTPQKACEAGRGEGTLIRA